MAENGLFTVINGREVFDNGTSKRWRCPKCEWWRDWEDEHCICGAPRYAGAAAPAPSHSCSSGGSEQIIFHNTCENSVTNAWKESLLAVIPVTFIELHRDAAVGCFFARPEREPVRQQPGPPPVTSDGVAREPHRIREEG
jgi:hypothetical protein